jgi:putative transposase
MMPAWNKPARRSPRLQGYDYAQSGAYFITICTRQREYLFGEIVTGEMRLNPLGAIVEAEWIQTGVARPYLILDEFVVMPNHFHAILFITDDPVGGRRASPLQTNVPNQPYTPNKPVSGSLPTIIGAFKSAVTKRINQHRDTPNAPVWQRSYHDHIIRSEKILNATREYILYNPACWDADAENPINTRG